MAQKRWHTSGESAHNSPEADHVQLQETTPLTDSLRPKSLEEFVGQIHLTGPNTLLFDSSGKVTTENVIFWGPPG